MRRKGKREGGRKGWEIRREGEKGRERKKRERGRERDF